MRDSKYGTSYIRRCKEDKSRNSVSESNPSDSPNVVKVEELPASDAGLNSSDTIAPVVKAAELPHSRLICLNEKAHKPEVCSHRVDYVKGSNQGDKFSLSHMTEMDLHAVAEFFPWPKGVRLSLPCLNGGSRAKYPGCIVIYEEAMKAGIRLPLHPMISKFLSKINFCPSQLAPNSWRCLLAFILKCKELDPILPYDTLMHIFSVILRHSFFYDVYFPSVNLISNPIYHDRSWENRWFLVSSSEEFCFNFPMYPSDLIRDKCFFSGIETVKFIQTLRQLPHPGPDYNEVLDARRLEEAGLSLPHPITGPGSLENQYNEYIAERKREIEMDRVSKKAETCTSQPNDDEEPEELDDDIPNEPMHVDIKKEPSREGGVDVLPDSVAAKAIETVCRPEFITALQRLPDILKAARHSEELQRQLDESKQEIAVLKREKAELKSQKDEIMQENVELKRRERKFANDLSRKEREFQSRIKSMELSKKSAEEQLRVTRSKLLRTTQKAKELFDISSSPLSIKKLKSSREPK